MEVLPRPDSAAVGCPEVFLIEELNIASVAVVCLERLEPLRKRQRARTDVDSSVLLEQRVTGGQHSVFKLAVHHGVEHAIEYHHISFTSTAATCRLRAVI